MDWNVRKVDLAVLFGFIAALAALAAVGWWLTGLAAILWVAVVGFGGLALLLLEIYRRLEPTLFEQRQNYRQLESLHSLHAVLQLRAPLPPMRHWAASPDFINILIDTVRRHRPTTVVELGSGVSTLVSGYLLEQQGAGHICTLEHDPGYAEKIRADLALHRLQDVVTVVDAPLVDTPLAGGSWRWYDLGGLTASGIDLLVVDGPPNPLQPLSRYPALPMLLERLSGNAVVLVDDGGERPVADMVRRWHQEYPELQVSEIDTEKGAFILRRAV